MADLLLKINFDVTVLLWANVIKKDNKNWAASIQTTRTTQTNTPQQKLLDFIVAQALHKIGNPEPS